MTSKNSGVPNFCSASSLLSRIFSNVSEITRTTLSKLASGMMKEKASTTGSELKILLEERFLLRMLLMEFEIQPASSDVLER